MCRDFEKLFKCSQIVRWKIVRGFLVAWANRPMNRELSYFPKIDTCSLAGTIKMSQPNIVASLKLPAFIVVVENVFSELFETKLQKRILTCRIATQCADSLAFKIHFELQQHQKSL